MENLTVIHNQEVLGKEFKVYGTNEAPLFLAKDVANWIEHSQADVMIKKIDEDEKVLNTIQTLGGGQKTWFITEDGLYEVLMQSRKPIAKAFKKEVKNILKTIRKTGGYVQENRAIDFVSSWLPQLDETTQNVIASTLEENRKLVVENKKLVTVVQEQQPKVEYHDTVLSAENGMTTTVIAKEFGMSAKTLNSILHSLGIQFKQNDQWFLYSKYADKGYTIVSTTVLGNGSTKHSSKWTEKGRKFIHWEIQKYKKELLSSLTIN